MGDNNQPVPVMGDFARPVVEASPSCIVLPTVARNYELKNQHYTILPTFHGMACEDPLNFIREFYSIVQTFPLSNLTEEQLRLRCFPFTLKDAAKTWFMTLTPGSLNTWEEVYNKFIAKFFTHQKTKLLRQEIANFNQEVGEPFHEAWDRFKMLLVKCPHHGFTLQWLNQTFYDALNYTSQAMVDNAAGGAIYEKNADETKALFEKLGQNSQQKSVRAGKKEVHEIGANSDTNRRLDMLTQSLETFFRTFGNQGGNMVKTACAICDLSTHSIEECPNRDQFPEFLDANANSINNFMPAGSGKIFDPTSNTYNPGSRFHPNLSWGGNQGNQRFQGQYQQWGPQQQYENRRPAYDGTLAEIVRKSG